MMSEDFYAMLILAAGEALGTSPKAESFSFKAVCELSQRHGCAPLTVGRLSQMYSPGADMTKDEFKLFCRRAYMAVMKNEARIETVSSGVMALESAGIFPVVLKGESIGRFYADPGERISGDTDLYIGGAPMLSAVKALKSAGFEIMAGTGYGHHICARHPSGGLIELHSKLFSDMAEQVWFPGAVLPSTEPVTFKGRDGRTYLSLSPQDNALFTFLHLVKHFVSSGLKARQLIDVLLCISRLDLAQRSEFDEAVSRIGFAVFADCCIAMGRRFGFEEIPFVVGEPEGSLVYELTNAFEKGSPPLRWERDSFRELYTKRRYESKTGKSYDSFKRRYWLSKLAQRLFPPRYAMGGRYSYCLDNGLLLPAAWLHRLAFMAARRLKQDPMAAEKNYDSERLALVEKMGM